ncbi:MAG: hypothetical protein ACI9JN_002889 [Bacteroidia bacterium]|jgi:hypothetical protein
MKITISFLLFILSFVPVYAQKAGFEWAEKAFVHSSSAKLHGKAILVDQNDNVFLFGVHVASNNASFRHHDMILAKYNPNGKRLWYKKYPTQTFPGHGSYKMYWDDNYNIVVAGEMNTIFGTDTLHKYTAALNATIGIVKLDSTGNYIWSTQVDAKVEDDFDFVQLANGNYAIRGEGTVTFKPDSVLSLTKKDFIAFIDSSGTVLTAKKTTYNAYASLGGLGTGIPRKIFSNGNSIASVMAATISNSPIPGVTPYIMFDEVEWVTGASIKETRIKYDGIGIFDYQYDDINRMLYFFGRAVNAAPVFNDKSAIQTTAGSELIIQYDLDGDSVVNYQSFVNIVQITHTSFSYDHGPTVVYNYRDSCKNIKLDSSYYELPNVASGFEGQNQYLLVNFNENLDYNLYVQYGTSNGSLVLYDLAHDKDGHMYGTTDGSSESYFDELKQGTLGNSDQTGFIFKIGDTSTGNNNSSISDFKRGHSTFSVYPNPATNQITVSFNEVVDRSYAIRLSNAIGQVVYETKPNSQHVTLNLNKLATGLYVVSITSAKGT